MAFKSGFCAIIGRSNAGKSTLLNRFIGEKIAIVSPKPQTSRNKISGILTTQDYQIVFEDTPGIFHGDGKLYKFMKKSWEQALEDTDCVIFVMDGKKPCKKLDFDILESLREKNVFVAVNKVDIAKKEEIFPILEQLKPYTFVKEIIPISAKKGENVDFLLQNVVQTLKEGPKYYEDDDITDKSTRFMVAEIIREKILLRLNEEIPHGVGINITNFEYRQDKKMYFIDAEIYCEKENHKQIIIGKQGSMLKTIGSFAREDIQELLQTPIYLNLFVKTRENWRENDNYLNDLGYNIKKL